MNNSLVILSGLVYLGLLFAVAYWAEHRLKQGKSLINNAYVYSLSLAVYCTAWTYYGSVGRASANGIEFLAIYLGPTVVAVLFWPFLRKLLRICKTEGINSVADFISTRYGKNFSLAAIVTVLCVIGVVPYIALQLKAITTSFTLLTQGTDNSATPMSSWTDSTLYITLLLAVFIILFGTRSVDASEKHEGMVAAIAFESIVKLAAFLAAGIFVCYGVFNGFGDIFSRAAASAELKQLFTLEPTSSFPSWFGLILLSMLAVVFLPRQFQVAVVENVQEAHLKKASWLFPLYLLIINLFVLPLAFAGNLLNTGAEADMFVLGIPLQFDKNVLSLFIFIGGFSAASSMIIVETIALSTMVSNNLVLPGLIRTPLFQARKEGNASQLIIAIRRFSIAGILLLAFAYDKLVAEKFSLVSIGLVSFVAVAQFAPAAIGGMYWKGASKYGALAGILAGFSIWFVTLVIPSIISAGLLPQSILEEGLFGIKLLKPFSLLGLTGLDSIIHSFFWSLFFNCLLFFGISFYSRKSAEELYHAEIFTDIFRFSGNTTEGILKRTASLPDLNSLLANFLGEERAAKILQGYAQRYNFSLQQGKADPRLVSFSEKVLSGIIGAASARIMVQRVSKEEDVNIEEVLDILRESQQILGLNKELRKKSTELQRATEQLTLANEQLKNLDQLKDEFLYTVTHELRTPLTSIRALTEIVHDNPDLPEEQRQHYLGAVVKETERLSHLITQVLNLERYESGRQKLQLSSVDLRELVHDTISSLQPLISEKKIQLLYQIPDSMLLQQCDESLLRQVFTNLISNAIKFVEPETGTIKISIFSNHDEWQVWIQDNGKGIAPELHELIFDKFFQAKNQTIKKPEGSGLGLAICKKIIEMHQGKIWVESEESKGARFIFTLPFTV